MSSETVRLVGTYITVYIVLIGSGVFLYLLLLSPNTVEAPETQANLVIGMIGALIGAASQFVFGAAQANAALRASEKATQAGVNAAMTTPSSTTTIDAGPPATVTTTSGPPDETVTASGGQG